MEEEIGSMESNYVWDLVVLPPGRKPIWNKWVIRVKQKVDVSIERYKARLVTKWYTNQEGIGYEEIFSPIERFASIHFILVIIAHMHIE